MKAVASLLLAGLLAGCDLAPSDPPESPDRPNQVAGVWRIADMTVETGGTAIRPYGARPNGMLVFTDDMRFIEVLTDGEAARFASDVRGEGTDAENRRAMGSSIGFFGTYTVDAEGRFTGNRVEGSTFPNWVGDVRTQEQLSLRVEGDRLYETFVRPDGGRVTGVFVRAR